MDAVVELHHSVVRPKPLYDLVAGNDLPAMVDQHHEDLEGLLLEQNLSRFAADLSSLEVQFKGPEPHATGKWDVQG